MNYVAVLIGLVPGAAVGWAQLRLMKVCVGENVSPGKRAAYMLLKLLLWAASLVTAALIEPAAAVGVALGGAGVYHAGAVRMYKRMKSKSE